MAITEIKRRNITVPVGLLSAGTSYKMRSYEPRSLLKYKDKAILEYQIEVLKSAFKCEIIAVIGVKSEKIIKKMYEYDDIRFVENQKHAETNAAESIRLAINNNTHDNLLLLHGDIVFNKETLSTLDFNKSFIVVDSKNQIPEREVGATCVNNYVTNLSYDLPLKWCQIAYFCKKEYEILKSICKREGHKISNKLFFEIVNMIIDRRGRFNYYEPENMKIFEIDCMGDLKNENSN